MDFSLHLANYVRGELHAFAQALDLLEVFIACNCSEHPLYPNYSFCDSEDCSYRSLCKDFIKLHDLYQSEIQDRAFHSVSPEALDCISEDDFDD